MNMRAHDREIRPAGRRAGDLNLKVGDVFSTPLEAGCVVTDIEDTTVNGSFLALDSEGVECQYMALMVVEVSVR